MTPQAARPGVDLRTFWIESKCSKQLAKLVPKLCISGNDGMLSNRDDLLLYMNVCAHYTLLYVDGYLF